MKTSLHQVAAVLSKRTLRPEVNKKRLAQEVAAYLLDTGRTGELNSLARDLVQVRAEHGVVEVSATSAHGLSDSIRADIRTQVTKLFPGASRVIINEYQDPEIIGGVRLGLVDQQLDATIRSKLNRLKTLTGAERTI